MLGRVKRASYLFFAFESLTQLLMPIRRGIGNITEYLVTCVTLNHYVWKHRDVLVWIGWIWGSSFAIHVFRTLKINFSCCIKCYIKTLNAIQLSHVFSWSTLLAATKEVMHAFLAFMVLVIQTRTTVDITGTWYSAICSYPGAICWGALVHLTICIQESWAFATGAEQGERAGRDMEFSFVSAAASHDLVCGRASAALNSWQ